MDDWFFHSVDTVDALNLESSFDVKPSLGIKSR